MNNHDRNHDRPGTPPPPPYSPVTPVLTNLAPVPGLASIGPPASSPSPTTTTFPPTTAEQYEIRNGPATRGTTTNITSQPPPVFFAPEPPPVPISESDNPDAIALRSAISILQLQKQQSVRDIRTLEKLKRAAIEDPERFAQELASGKLTGDQREDGTGFIRFDGAEGVDEEDDEEEEEQDQDGQGQGQGSQSKAGQGSTFGKIPKPQNVVRMPPINWAKYHIVGEPLDKLHEEQLKRPVGGEPRRGSTTAAGAAVGAGVRGDGMMMSGSVSRQQRQQQQQQQQQQYQSQQERAPEYLLAAPYRPLVDKVESQTPSPSKIKVSPSKRGKS